MHLQRRSVLLGLLAAGIGGSGCMSLGSTEPELQESFDIPSDKTFITGQPERTDETTVWLDYTTDPEAVKQLVDWQKIQEDIRWSPENEDRYYGFERGEKCVVVVVAQHTNDEYNIEGFNQSDAEMFDTGIYSIEFVKSDDNRIGEFLYAVSLWDLGETTVPETIEPTVGADPSLSS